VSARNQEGTIAILRHFEIEHLFDLIVTSQTTVHSKPYPDPLIFVSEQLMIPAENLVMVGDTVVDILAGKAVGAQTIGVLCGFGTRQELTQAGADFILDSTAQLPVALWQDHE
jgi:N-acetyl-D-muramate 6-phosphate phosphatase